MGFFRKKEDEEWNIWDDVEFEDDSPPVQPQQIETYNNQEYQNEDYHDRLKKQKKHKKRTFRKKEEYEPIIESDIEPDYLNNPGDQIYYKDEEEKFQISFVKVGGFLLGAFLIFAVVVGFLSTDFDENNKAYVVSYDLHYERDYVKQSDNVLEYCEELHEKLPQVMQSMQTNTISSSKQIEDFQNILTAKTKELSRYTQIPEMMSTYHNDLITFAMSTQEMLNSILQNYNSSDYMDWAAAAYTDFENGLDTLRVLRGEINTIIYRNVYANEQIGGGDKHE